MGRLALLKTYMLIISTNLLFSFIKTPVSVPAQLL